MSVATPGAALETVSEAEPSQEAKAGELAVLRSVSKKATW